MATSLSREELIMWANESVAFYGIDLTRVSTVLLAQSFAMKINRVINIFDLTQPIKVLEGLSSFDGTGPEEIFKRAPLTGLYKKHFTSPRFLVKNLSNFSQSEFGKKHFQRKWEEAARENESGVFDEAFARHIAHHMTLDPVRIKSEAGRMTGEWLVFHKHEGKNYYLTFGAHDEDKEKIHERILLACEFDNFPCPQRDARQQRRNSL